MAAAVIVYPGITNVLDLDLEVGHGILPGTAVLTCSPVGFAPDAEGSLQFGTTGSTLTFISCRYDRIRSERARSDTRSIALINDRRWKWMIGPPIYGDYNQLDDHGKLIPRTVRSPTQLAKLCLAAMGETSYDIDLPPGLARPAGAGIPAPDGDDVVITDTTQYLQLGQNLPPSGTNLHVRWGGGLTAAQALAQLCARFGRTICPRLTTTYTAVVPLGSGAGLPDLPADMISAEIDPSGVPANIVVIGAESRFQPRFLFRAVAEEWDGSHVPLAEVSYAPDRPGQAMVCRATGPWFTATTYQVAINGVDFRVVTPGAGADTHAVVTSLATAITASANPLVNGKVTAAAVNDGGTWHLEVTGTAVGYEFEFTAATNTGDEWKAQCVKGPVPVVAVAPAVFQVATVGPYVQTDDYTVTVNGVAFTRHGVDAPVSLNYRMLLEQKLMVDILSSVNPAVQGKVTASVWQKIDPVNGEVAGLEIQALTTDPLTVTSARTPTADPFVVTGLVTTQIRAPANVGRGFEYTSPQAGPFGFPSVKPTPRLSWSQAMELASRSVFRRYQLVMADPGDRQPGVKIPFIYDPLTDTGRVTERHRIVLQDTMPEQTAPRGGDVARVDPLTGEPFAAEVYDGYSRDRRPRAFGSLFQGVSAGGLYVAGGYLGANTLPRSEFYVPFRVIDPLRGIIEFAAPVYRVLGTAGGTPGNVTVHPAGEAFGLTVETGAILLTTDTQVPYRYLRPLAIPGGTGPDQGFEFDEVQVEYRGYYDQRHNLVGVSTIDAYGQGLADVLAAQIAATFQVPTGVVKKFYGTQTGIELTGQVREIKYEISKAGIFTTASQNTEFSRVLPPPAPRRRQENLPPDPAQVQSNLQSSPLTRFRNAAMGLARLIGGLFGK